MQSVARVRGDLDHLHAQALGDLQDAEIRGRLHRDGVAGRGHHAHGQRQRLHAAVGDDEFLRGHCQSHVGVVARDLLAQCQASPHPHWIFTQQRRVTASDTRQAGAKRRCGKQRRIWKRLTQSRDAGRQAGIGQPFQDGLCAGQPRAARQLHFRRRLWRWPAARNEIAGLRPGFDEPALFELAQAGHRGGDAHAPLPRELAHRGHPLQGLQRAGLDHRGHVLGHGDI